MGWYIVRDSILKIASSPRVLDGPGGDRKPGERLREPEKRGRESSEKPNHVQSVVAKMLVWHELAPKHQKVRRKM